MPSGSGLNGDYNYVRNSIKAVVDAYEGTVKFYVIDPDDPLAAAYADAFPDPLHDEIPDELRAHFRYPEDLFRIQTNMWGRYHLSDPDDFYTEAGAWDVSQDPGDESSTTTPVDARGDPAPGGRRAPHRPDLPDPAPADGGGDRRRRVRDHPVVRAVVGRRQPPRPSSWSLGATPSTTASC